MSASLEISDCPICHAKGKVYLDDASPQEIIAWVGCGADGCGFYVPDVKAPRTTEIAKELLKLRAIRKWNESTKEYKEINCV